MIPPKNVLVPYATQAVSLKEVWKVVSFLCPFPPIPSKIENNLHMYWIVGVRGDWRQDRKENI